MARIDAPAAATPARLPWIDALRGVAILAMIVYHFAWDLHFFGFIAADVTGALGWRAFARSIAGSFLALVGISLVLATRHGLDGRRFLRRLAIIAAAAAAVTAATYVAMPDAYVFFGILHAIAVSSVLGLAFVHAPVLIVIAAALFCFAAPALLSGPVFDAPPLLWLGLSTYIPRSNDYVPVFPWFGVVLVGIAVARLLLHFRPGWLHLLARPAAPSLVWAGRHSLAIYLLHQPILIGLVYLVAQIAPPTPLGLVDSHFNNCIVQCTDQGMQQGFCGRACGCLTERAEAEGLTADVLANSLGEAEMRRYFDIGFGCREEAAGAQ
ncbi:MAG TPA: heparan-alpha-glucosaminide N-acetyltransferase [Propylenella sp.]|nr:heparan-alpha-glucosaminide N-acetyltransferase [Propylenella sp.]